MCWWAKYWQRASFPPDDLSRARHWMNAHVADCQETLGFYPSVHYLVKSPTTISQELQVTMFWLFGYDTHWIVHSAVAYYLLYELASHLTPPSTVNVTILQSFDILKCIWRVCTMWHLDTSLTCVQLVLYRIWVLICESSSFNHWTFKCLHPMSTHVCNAEGFSKLVKIQHILRISRPGGWHKWVLSLGSLYSW